MTTVQSVPSTPNASTPRRPIAFPVIVIAAALFLMIGFGVALMQANITPPDTGPAPDFSLTTFNGQPFRLADQRGKITVINFWASWCNTCPGEAPILNSLWDDYQNRGVTLIGIAHLDNQSDSLAFMKQYAMNYPAAPDDGNHASDAYHIKQVPETYVIDQRGQIVYAVHGPLDNNSAQALRTKLDQLLAAPAAPKAS
ncbi:MAG: TlpA family protein disulfide reductase [Aggregatilineales bacterium]